MRTLLIEPTPAGGASVAGDLTAIGHDVVRCHPADGPSFPCAALTHEGCPLDHGAPLDVTVVVRDEARAEPTTDESAVTCAVRAGVPVVVVGPPGPDPYGDWSEACHDPDDVAAACDRAVQSAAERRAAPLAAEVQRLIDLEGVDVGEVAVEVEREGAIAHVRVRTDRPLPTGLAGTVATRVHAVDQEGTWPTGKLSVSFGPVD